MSTKKLILIIIVICFASSYAATLVPYKNQLVMSMIGKVGNSINISYGSSSKTEPAYGKIYIEEVLNPNTPQQVIQKIGSGKDSSIDLIVVPHKLIIPPSQSQIHPQVSLLYVAKHDLKEEKIFYIRTKHFDPKGKSKKEDKKSKVSTQIRYSILLRLYPPKGNIKYTIKKTDKKITVTNESNMHITLGYSNCKSLAAFKKITVKKELNALRKKKCQISYENVYPHQHYSWPLKKGISYLGVRFKRNDAYFVKLPLSIHVYGHPIVQETNFVTYEFKK